MDKSTQHWVLAVDLPKYYGSYLYCLLNPSQTEGFLSFLLKIHFIANFNRLLLLSRLVKRILCSCVWEFLHALLFIKMLSYYLSLWAFQGKQVCPYPWADSWPIQAKKQTVIRSYFAHSKNTSPIACETKLNPFPDQGKLILPYNETSLLPQKYISLTYFGVGWFYLFSFSDKRFIFSPNIQLCLSESNSQKKGARTSMPRSAQTERFVTVPCLEQSIHKQFGNTQCEYSE